MSPFYCYLTLILVIYRTILDEISESMCNFRTFYFNIYLFCNFASDNHLLNASKSKIFNIRI